MVTERTTSARLDPVSERVQELFDQRSRAVVDMDILGDEPLPADMQQDTPVQQALLIIQDRYSGVPGVFIRREPPIRFDPSDRRKAVIPDIGMAKDVDLDPILALPSNSYIIWEVGKPPDLVIEVASPSTYEKDVWEKPGIYESIGVPEYWMFDYTGGMFYGASLIGRRLVDGSYERMDLFENEDGLECGYSEVLGLNLCVASREQRSALLSRQPNLVFQEDYHSVQLMFQDPETGLYLLNYEGHRQVEREAEEARQRAESRAQDAESRAQDAESRAQDAETERDTERIRAEEAEAELARLRERIRRMEQG